jgi:hypothetical protein
MCFLSRQRPLPPFLLCWTRRLALPVIPVHRPPQTKEALSEPNRRAMHVRPLGLLGVVVPGMLGSRPIFWCHFLAAPLPP